MRRRRSDPHEEAPCYQTIRTQSSVPLNCRGSPRATSLLTQAPRTRDRSTRHRPRRNRADHGDVPTRSPARRSCAGHRDAAAEHRHPRLGHAQLSLLTCRDAGCRTEATLRTSLCVRDFVTLPIREIRSTTRGHTATRVRTSEGTPSSLPSTEKS